MPEFTMQQQSDTNWCWSAVAVAVNNYLDPEVFPPLTQSALATQVLRKLDKISIAVDCTATPGLCNFTAPLETVFTTTNNLSAAFPTNILTFNSLKGQIDAGRPVCAQIDWFGGGAHAIALDGYQIFASGAQTVTVQDPANGPSIQFYDDLVNDYLALGVWAGTFTVKP